MKQTATNYLIEQLELKVMAEHIPWVAEILDKAIEMEKEQMIEAYRDGRSDQQSDRQSRFYNRTADQYYNETFNNESND
jgi:hypothetical protein